jgi:hypothetical protein
VDKSSSANLVTSQVLPHPAGPVQIVISLSLTALM